MGGERNPMERRRGSERQNGKRQPVCQKGFRPICWKGGEDEKNEGAWVGLSREEEEDGGTIRVGVGRGRKKRVNT